MTQANRLLLTLFVALMFSIAVAGCSAARITLQPEGGAYDSSTVSAAADTLGVPAASGRPVSEAESLRHEALVELRAHGETGADAADLLTTQFPGESRSVPYHVEAGRFEGVDAWIVFEVWGTPDGRLEHTRVWVFERGDGARVLFTAAVN